MNPLAEIHRHLQARGVDHALIGALAVGLHGHSRATNDADFLTTDGAILTEGFWAPLREAGWNVEILLGEFADPLAGSAMLEPPEAGPPIDVIVGKWKWQEEVVARAGRGVIHGVELPVVVAADLVLLKLDAGGPQDLNDVRALLGVATDPASLRSEIESRVDRLESRARAAWREVAGAG